MARFIGGLLAIGVACGVLAVLPASADAQVCVPGAPLPGCPPPPPTPPPPPPPTPPPPTGGAPGEEGRPPPAEPAGCEPVGRRERGSFVGMVSEDVFAGGPNYRSCTLNTQVDGGVALVRQTFDWASIERSRGHYDFGFYDAYVAALAAHRVRLLPVLFNPPAFRSSRPRRRAKRGTYPPKRYRDLGRFGAVLVRRYGPRGSFWRSHADLPKVPIRSWQIWNEPHLRVYWPSGPSPRRYTRLLRAARKGIKRADRHAEVVTAALSQSNLSQFSLASFVSGMYRAGGRSAFDTLAVNPYGRSPRAALGAVRRIRRLMNSRGDWSGRIWVTEFGWATGGRSKKFRVSQRKQAHWVERLLRSFHRSRRRLRLRGAIYYNWRDANPYPPLFQDFFGLHTGLLRTDGSPKPAFWTFRRAVRRIR